MNSNVQTKITAHSHDRERTRAHQELAAHANRVPSTARNVETLGDSTAQTIWSDDDPIPFSSAVEFSARVVAVSSTGAAYAMAEVTGLFRRGSSGAAAQIGAQQTRHSLVSAGVALVIGVDAASKLFVTLDDGGAVLAGRVFIEERPV